MTTDVPTEVLEQALGLAAVRIASRLDDLGELDWFELELRLGTRGQNDPDQVLRRPALERYLTEGLAGLPPEMYLEVHPGEGIVSVVVDAGSAGVMQVRLVAPESVTRFQITSRYEPLY